MRAGRREEARGRRRIRFSDQRADQIRFFTGEEYREAVRVVRTLPEKIINSVVEIAPELLRAEGVEGLVLDLDNTLAGRRAPLPGKAMRAWANSMQSAGVRMILLSNNHSKRVGTFAQAMGLPFLCNALKPLPWGFRRALRELGLPPGRAAAVGDQIFTDVLGAHRAGMRAWLVLPIDRREPPFTKLRRALERRILRRHGALPPGWLPGGEPQGGAKTGE